MKIACVHHSIDLDGWMSAAIVKHWFVNTYCKPDPEDGSPVSNGESLCMIGFNYGQEIPDLTGFDKVIMCDISFPHSEMMKLFKQLDTNFIWIDHHISAIKENGEIDEWSLEDISTLFNGLRRTDFAACELTWQFLFPTDTMPELVRLLGRYDCFGHKGTDEEQDVLEFQYGARSYISNHEDAYNCLMRTIYDPSHPDDKHIIDPLEPYIFRTGKAIYKYLCKEAEQAYAHKLELRIQKSAYGHKMEYWRFMCVNKDRFNPINFGINYEKQGFEGAACFTLDSDGKYHFSLYNDNGYVDCSVIAKRMGGGGHRGASGFVVDSLADLERMGMELYHLNN